jgi:hypothetical protein
MFRVNSTLPAPMITTRAIGAVCPGLAGGSHGHLPFAYD